MILGAASYAVFGLLLGLALGVLKENLDDTKLLWVAPAVFSAFGLLAGFLIAASLTQKEMPILLRWLMLVATVLALSTLAAVGVG